MLHGRREETELRREATALKELVPEQASQIRLFKKAWLRMGKTKNEVLAPYSEADGDRELRPAVRRRAARN